MNKLVANISWLLIGRIIQMILSFIVFIFTVRYLGPANYGTITYVNSYVAFFLNASTLGLDAVVINQLVKKQAGDGEIITSATLLRLIASLIAYILLLFTVANTDAGNREMLIITVIDGLQMIFYSFFTINLWFQYHLESKITAIADVAALAVTSILKVFSGSLHSGADFSCPVQEQDHCDKKDDGFAFEGLPSVFYLDSDAFSVFTD
jgi:O-antigen/teichoic acid export membrane protein